MTPRSNVGAKHASFPGGLKHCTASGTANGIIIFYHINKPEVIDVCGKIIGCGLCCCLHGLYIDSVAVFPPSHCSVARHGVHPGAALTVVVRGHDFRRSVSGISFFLFFTVNHVKFDKEWEMCEAADVWSILVNHLIRKMISIIRGVENMLL